MRRAIEVAEQARAPRLAAAGGRVRRGRPHDGAVHDGATEGRTGPHAEIVALRAAGAGRPGGDGLRHPRAVQPPRTHPARAPTRSSTPESRRVVVGARRPRSAGGRRGHRPAPGGRASRSRWVSAPTRCEAQLWAYLIHRRTGRPAVVLKLAASLDGRTAAPDGTSQWITGAEARADAHRLRAESDAVLVGAGHGAGRRPARSPCASPSSRQLAGFRQPLRVVLGRAPRRRRGAAGAWR